MYDYIDRGRLIVHPIRSKTSISPLVTSATARTDLGTDGTCELHHLCGACRRVFGESKLIRGSWKVLIPSAEIHLLHNNLAELEISVAEKCHFCSLIAKNVKFGTTATIDTHPTSPLENPDCVHLGIMTRFGNWGKSYAIIVKHGLPGTIKQLISQQHGYSNTFRLDLKDVKQALTLSHTTTGSTVHIVLTRMWLEECLENHLKCGNSRESFVPTRLLDVGRVDEQHIKLKICKPEDREVQYCTLSHCWGGVDEILTLRTNNIETLQSAVVMTQLPRTFQQAVAITRHLGLKFLWIDSLCIIQDSPEDWATEAVKMGQVYENSTCTIAAAAANDSHGGCFSNRDPLSFSSCLIARRGNGTTGLWATLDESNRDRRDRTPEVPRLQTRAWVFQEEKLSRRTLYFGRNEIRWSCGLGKADEADPIGRGVAKFGGGEGFDYSYGPLFGDSRWDKLWSSPNIQDYDFSSKFPVLGSRDSGYDFHLKWFNEIANYTKRQLSFPTDRLIALAGIAARIEKKTARTYLGGLWQETIYDDLLWRINGEPGSRSSEYIAPTWSWASAIGPVASPYWHLKSQLQYAESNDSLTIMAEVKSIEISAASISVGKFGKLCDGSLTIEGCLRMFNVDLMGHGSTGLRSPSNTFADGKVVRFFPDSSEPLSRVFLLPMKRILINRKGQRNIFWCGFDLRIEGIALTFKNDFYERVGFFGIYSLKMEPEIFNFFKDLPKQIILIK